MEKFQTAFVKCMDMPPGAANGAAELHFLTSTSLRRCIAGNELNHQGPGKVARGLFRCPVQDPEINNPDAVNLNPLWN